MISVLVVKTPPDEGLVKNWHDNCDYQFYWPPFDWIKNDPNWTKVEGAYTLEVRIDNNTSRKYKTRRG